MKVKELIALLQKCDQEREVLTWDPYLDNETRDVKVSRFGWGLYDQDNIIITNHIFGEEIK